MQIRHWQREHAKQSICRGHRWADEGDPWHGVKNAWAAGHGKLPSTCLGLGVAHFHVCWQAVRISEECSGLPRAHEVLRSSCTIVSSPRGLHLTWPPGITHPISLEAGAVQAQLFIGTCLRLHTLRLFCSFRKRAL